MSWRRLASAAAAATAVKVAPSQLANLFDSLTDASDRCRGGGGGKEGWGDRRIDDRPLQKKKTVQGSVGRSVVCCAILRYRKKGKKEFSLIESARDVGGVTPRHATPPALAPLSISFVTT